MHKLLKAVWIVLHFPVDVWQMFITYLPGRGGQFLRYVYWRRRLGHLGKKVNIDVGVYFQNPKFISIDDHRWIDRGVVILAGRDRSHRHRHLIANPKFPLEKGRVYIGKHVHIAPYAVVSGIGGVYIADKCGLSSGVRIYSFSHHYRSNEQPSNRNIYFSPLVQEDGQFLIEGPVFLDTSVGVALNAIILPGVSIAKDSFVAINSVVSASILEENSLIAGNPAVRIRSRFRDI